MRIKLDTKAIEVKSKKLVQFELEAFGLDVVRDAKLLAPVDLGSLRNLIGSQKAKNGVKITSGADYAAYVEFGTGVFAAKYLATQPSEVQKYARKFFVSGKGRLPASPHIFPALYKNLKILKDRLGRK